jgi:hypothetical protein
MKGISALLGVAILDSQLTGGAPLSGSVECFLRGVRFPSGRRAYWCVSRERTSVPDGEFFERRLGRMGIGKMVASQAETLRKAIENLIDAKLHDALSRPGGLERLTAHRLTGVASFDIRNAERKLQQTLAEILSAEPVNG